MSAPVIWIVFPFIIGLVAWLLRRNYGLSYGLVIGVSILLSVLAGVLPVGQIFRLGNVELEIGESLFFLGRSFNLTNNERPFLMLVFTACSIWFVGGLILKQHRFFASFGLMVVSALVAALAVQPFLYAALLVQIAVLLSIPLLVPPGELMTVGVQRYLIFQTLGMPFILVAGWVFGSGEIGQIDPTVLPRAAVILGLGFALWLAVFPFYFWLPQLTNQTHPYSAGFVLSLLPVSILMLGLDFINQVGWLRASTNMFLATQIGGILMVVTAGIWAAFQDDIRRLFGYAIILETGYALMAIGENALSGYMMFAASLLPRLLGLFMLSLSLAIYFNRKQLTDFDHLQGVFQRFPVTTIGLVLALFSIAGVPLLAGFPVRLEILEQLAARQPFFIGWVLVGNLGFIIGVLRVLMHVVQLTDAPVEKMESRLERVVLSAGMIFLFLFGIMPAGFYEGVIFVLRAAPALLQAP